jgi:hypothetical protein
MIRSIRPIRVLFLSASPPRFTPGGWFVFRHGDQRRSDSRSADYRLDQQAILFQFQRHPIADPGPFGQIVRQLQVTTLVDDEVFVKDMLGM